MTTFRLVLLLALVSLLPICFGAYTPSKLRLKGDDALVSFFDSTGIPNNAINISHLNYATVVLPSNVNLLQGASIQGNLEVSGDATFTGTVTIPSLTMDTPLNATVDMNLGDATINDLSIQGPASIKSAILGDVTVSSLTVTNKLSVDGNAIITNMNVANINNPTSGSVSVSGVTSIGKASVGSATVSGSLNTPSATFSGVSTTTTTVSGPLTSSSSYLGTATTSSNVTVSGTITANKLQSTASSVSIPSVQPDSLTSNTASVANSVIVNTLITNTDVTQYDFSSVRRGYGRVVETNSGDGGSYSTAKTWINRVLNTIADNWWSNTTSGGPISSLSSNGFYLVPGKYIVNAMAYTMGTGRSLSRLVRRQTDLSYTTVLNGNTVYTDGSSHWGSGHSMINGVVDATTNTGPYYIQSWGDAARPGDAWPLGVAAPGSGDPYYVYTQVEVMTL